jgi:hypothetical protein
MQRVSREDIKLTLQILALLAGLVLTLLQIFKNL